VADNIRVDLHCHSSASDGDHSPSYVAHSVAATGAEWAALTDHNTLAGQQEFCEVLRRRGVQYVVGVEIDARSPVGPFHIVGYGVKPDDGALEAAMRTVREPWRSSYRHFMDRVRALGNRRPIIPRPCVPAGEDPSPHLPPDTREVICLIHRARGLAFLAHPLAGLGSIAKLDEVLTWLQPQGLDGLEAFHKKYPLEMQNDLLELAERRGLLTVAGSDFHGLHHSDGGSPGVDMPLIHLNRFIEAVRAGYTEDASSQQRDDTRNRRGHIGQ
jgi:predicted metal-dependent phosphoesterase TrpH